MPTPPTTPAEAETALQQAAQAPKRFDSDQQSVHSHNLGDRIAVTDRLAANTNAKKKNRGLLFSRVQHGGTAG